MSRPVTSRADLLDALKSGTVPAQGLVRKSLVPDAVESIEGSDRTLQFTISTAAVDRDNDTVNALGWELENYKRNPVVLWAHDYSQLPVGKATKIGVEGGNLKATTEFADHAFAETVFRMLKGGFLRATSVGFAPKTYKMNEARGGLDFETQELLEFSIVPVPANPEALIEARAAGIDISPLKGWAEAVMKGLASDKLDRLRERWTEDPIVDVLRGLDLDDDEDDPVRWNRALSKAFDVDGEPAEPSAKLYGWCSRFLSVPVKGLYETSVMYGGAKMGAQLVALDEQLGGFRVDSVRNLNDRNGTEAPPVYETITLNSTKAQDFLVDGCRFLSPKGEGVKMVVRSQPSWGGTLITLFCAAEAKDHALALLGKAHRRSHELNFLKGEAFTLSGEFLTREPASFDDVFLAPAVVDPIRRTVKLLNDQGKGMDSRGLILMGPPGTGKTLVARTLMHECKDSTFIWLSSRDFSRMGMFGGLETAYDLAKENAPAVVFMDDIDSWWSDYSVDLLKTTLDGLSQNTGIVSILATNHPESLPEALIDRPGRFHDVLMLDLPTERIRREMLQRWAPDAPAAVLDQIARETLQFSGAHLRDLVRYAETIRSQDGKDLAEALTLALTKIREQRSTIDAARAPKRRAVKAFSAKLKHGTGTCDRCEAEGVLAAGVCPKCCEELHGLTGSATLAATAALAKERKAQMVGELVAVLRIDTTEATKAVEALLAKMDVAEKRGRVLSSANEGRMRRAKDLIEEVLRQVEAQSVESTDDADPEGKNGIGRCGFTDGGDGTTCGQIATEACTNCGAGMCGTHVHATGVCMACGTKAAKAADVLEIADDEVLDLADEHDGLDIEDGPVSLSVDPEDLRAAIASAFAESRQQLVSVVRAETAAAINRARGRVE